MALSSGGPHKVNVLIYYADLYTELLKSRLPNDHFHFRSFLIEENDEIILKSLTYLTLHRCRQLQLVNINSSQ